MTKTNISRDERQKMCVDNWLKNKGIGTIVGSTGFGKTRCALQAIQRVRSKYPNLNVIIVVPTTTLKDQWIDNLSNWSLLENTEVLVINTVIKNKYITDLLIIDEIHCVAAPSFLNVFQSVKYSLVLGLTATFERLDGKHELIKKYCPIVDTVSLADSIINGWAAEYTEYKVIVNVDNIEEYEKLNKEFLAYFEFFNFNFNLAFACSGAKGYENKIQLAKQLCIKKIGESDASYKKRFSETYRKININSIGFWRVMQKRKLFINNHSKKVEIARKIIEARPNAKIITFSSSVNMARAIGIGDVYSGKNTKKQGEEIMEKFKQADKGVLNTVKKVEAGLDCPGLSVGIVLGLNSSEISSKQKVGRVIRKEGDKTAEFFTIVINHTQELKWYNDSHKDIPYITIDEENLYKVLKNEPFETYKKPLKEFNYRF